MLEKLEVTSFYCFRCQDQKVLSELKIELLEFCNKRNILGLILLASEGVNATCAGSLAVMKEFREYCKKLFALEESKFRNNFCHKQPFRRLKIDFRKEIVTSGTDYYPQGKNNHLTPAEWHEVLSKEADVRVIDVRNFYETKLGKFRGAIDPQTKVFSEFPEFVKKSGLAKDSKVLMYCTGGVRCEKAIYEMQKQGFTNVYQLEGGILRYLEEFGPGFFEGECFVFDHRVSVDSDLKPTQHYKLCPHCGNPAESCISCDNCGKSAYVCETCLSDTCNRSCSKNCAYHCRRTAPSTKISEKYILA